MESRPSITFTDEHRPIVQTYKAVWTDESGVASEAGFNISSTLRLWISEAMEHIYNGGPKPSCKTLPIGGIGPREITSPRQP